MIFSSLKGTLGSCQTADEPRSDGSLSLHFANNLKGTPGFLFYARILFGYTI